MSFYLKILNELVASGDLRPEASTLVVAGGAYDRECLLAAGFSNVTISNLDTRMRGDEFAPFDWSSQDAENLALADGVFDQVIEHAGLHHCASPHRALLEMYRVASQSVLVFENRDSVSMKLAARLGLTQNYEFEAVVDNDFAFGGVRNTSTPNYVYRWTEREVAKTLTTNDPGRALDVRYFYNLRLPIERLAMHRSRSAKALVMALSGPATLFARLFKRQGNEFAFFVRKNQPLMPWINTRTGGLDRAYGDRKFSRSSG